ncbi:MAG TPA: BREX-3 system P-loop-containing protein BrxF [bacterium]|nr:BREX-3 system P-loop-containing protein BrxF [bacterium]HPG47056.1 BREX-3 system P-loop-containing protein BrxF [bacterium]HPM99356.1 BREX-3 system P-loop-containing protein BrxF [bacterium]
MPSLTKLLAQADALRFKLLAIVGKDEEKKKRIIKLLRNENWTLVDVEKELIELRKQIDSSNQGIDIEIATQIKEWFLAKPNYLILVNASILYHDLFLKTSPIGAFKYNSRNKNCVLFLENESKLGKRLYYGEMGKEGYYDREINDIVMVGIDEVDDILTPPATQTRISDEKQLPPEAIGSLFQFHPIKDVIDIDADLKEIHAKRELVGSFIISDSLQQQIIDFFEDLEKPTHKARTVIGNYGSGKSHLVGFLSSLVQDPSLATVIANEQVKAKAKQISHKFLTVQFELQSGQVELKQWFYTKVRKQLKEKYDLEVPVFDPQKDFDDKENIAAIIDIVKQHHPAHGLMVVIDEISDFLSAKQKEAMKADLQFLRVLGQVCQDQDFMFVGSMQEDVFSSPKFQDVAAEIGRIGERFQTIIIHKEDIKKVIAERIVSKSAKHRHLLEQKFKPYAEKIEPVSRELDDYIDLFPLTPLLIELFSDLPYFEKRGVIQFAIAEIRTVLAKPFPYFITFDRIYDLLENNPNKRNLEEIYDITKAMNILRQKISLLDNRLQPDAEKVVKGLAVYSLWNKREQGATAEELANNLMLLPQQKLFSAADNISLIIKKIREVTEGQYIRAHKDQNTGIEYFSFDTTAGPDPEQKIAQKAAAVSEDEIEHELFNQLRATLDDEPFENRADVLRDECEWRSVKSFRQGLILLAKKGFTFQGLPEVDYAVIFISPFAKPFGQQIAKHQLSIKLHIDDPDNIERLKEIVAIKSLIELNFQKNIMVRKLDGRINGYTQGSTQVTGLRFRLARLITHFSECELDGKACSIKTLLGRERNSVQEILEEVKTSVFDLPFNTDYPDHPVYSVQLSSRNIIPTLNSVASELIQSNFSGLSRSSQLFLSSLDLLDSQHYPDLSRSKIALLILDRIKSKSQQVTDIEKDLVQPMRQSDYGLEREVVHFFLVLTTLLGKTYLQLKGGERIDINTIKEKLKSLAAFESIAYVRLQETQSYDFAARLLNALGLNGSHMHVEKQRMSAFREYKEKLETLYADQRSLTAKIQHLKQRPKIYIDMQTIEKQAQLIQDFEWQALNINNYTQFGTIDHLSARLDQMVLKLNDLKNLNEALAEYTDAIHDDITYMNDALDLLEEHPLLVTDVKKHQSLSQYRDEVMHICQDADQFLDRGQRMPVKGKIQQFKKIFLFDFYIPAHEKYVGHQAKWSELISYPELQEFKNISLLSGLTCINDTQFREMVIKWNDLKTHQCLDTDLEETLKSVVRCQKCLFPNQQNYRMIPDTLNQIHDDILALDELYRETAIKEMRAYRDNLQYLDGDEKQFIESILKAQKLPDHLSPQTIQTINKLFKEIDVVAISRDTLMTRLFPDNQMCTLEELRTRFLSLEKELIGDRQESTIRIKLE